jgi:hypothetical protein
MYELHELYSLDETYKECLANADTPYLSSSTIEELQKDERLQYLSKINTSDSWSLSYEFLEFQKIYFQTDITMKSKRVLEALEVTSISDIYQYDHIKCFSNDPRLIWAVGAYENFIDNKNEVLQCENPDLFKKIEKFPITQQILQELILYWTPLYAVNTIRNLISYLNQEQIQNYNEKLSHETWEIIHASLDLAQQQRDRMCRIENKRLEGLGKAPALYPVLFDILDLMPKSFETRDFSVSLFLFMLCTGQRYITICNIKLSDIKSVVFKGNKLSIKIICRITKANEDWNQPFILEGELEDYRIMNFVYWLNKF